MCFCPLQTPFQTVTVLAVRPVEIQTSLLTEIPQPILVCQNSLLPTQRKDYITRMCYWLWRGGLPSSGGRVDHTLSLYHTRSEGIPKRFPNGHIWRQIYLRGLFRDFFNSNVCLLSPSRVVSKIQMNHSSGRTYRVSQNKDSRCVYE